MTERVIQISSIHRQKIGNNLPNDFLIKFTPALKLDPKMKHEIGVDRVSMTYSWHNISLTYNNNVIKYSTDGNTWETVTFVDGMYSYSDLNDYLHQYMDKKNHKTGNIYHINLIFVLSTYRVIIEVDNNYQLDLRGSDFFGDLIGFDKKIISQTEYGVKLPNITNSIDVIYINSDIVSDSIVDGKNTNTLSVIPTDNLTRSYPFTIEPKRVLYNTVSSLNISQMRFYLTDSIDRPIKLNGIDWYLTLILKSTS